MPVELATIVQTPIAGNAAPVWLLSAAAAASVIVALLLARRLIGSALQAHHKRAQFSWRVLMRDVVQRTSLLFIVIAGLYIGSRIPELPSHVQSVIGPIFVVALFVQAAIWADRLFDAAMDWQLSWRGDGSIRSALSLIRFIGRVAVWSIAMLLILDNLGFDVTALVAGLGIGGIAVALAAQNILGDLFASLAIVLDKPFEVGDFIVFEGDFKGTVERIGIKTTRIRSLSGEQLVVANNDLLRSRIRNYKRMLERRSEFTIGVTYQTPYEKLAALPGILRAIVEEQGDRARFDRAHLREFGDSSINFEIVYWVPNPDMTFYLDVQQAINLAIVERFAAESIEFAYPTRTIHVQGGDRDPALQPAS